MDTKNFYKCDAFFRNESDSNCVCEKATHCGWKFGRRNLINPIDYYEEIASSHSRAFEKNDFKDCETLLKKDETGS